MLARKYHKDGVGSAPLDDWTLFLDQLARDAFATLRPGGYFTLLLATQTEKDLPRGFGYIDHTFLGYRAGTAAGFLPERRISCPMNGNYRPQQVRRARVEGRLLGQVRDLLVMRKPQDLQGPPRVIPQTQSSRMREAKDLSPMRPDAAIQLSLIRNHDMPNRHLP